MAIARQKLDWEAMFDVAVDPGKAKSLQNDLLQRKILVVCVVTSAQSEI